MTDHEASAVLAADVVWRPAALTYLLLGSAATAMVLAVALGRGQLLLFAAPLLGVAATAPWQCPRTRIQADSIGIKRCFESEPVDFDIAAFVVTGHGVLHCTPDPVPGLTLRGTAPADTDVAATRISVTALAQRWGRYPLAVRVSAVSPAGLHTATVRLELGQLCVYPVIDPQRMPLPRAELPDRFGTHLTRKSGPGVEYADIRPYVPGDQLRTVNWPVSARRGRLYVTERLTHRAAEVVIVVDTAQQAPGPASAALELSVRGAAQVAQSSLQAGDRTAVVCLGQAPRWLRPDIGRRQFYRIVDTVLAVGDEHIGTAGTLAPHAALPPGAVVIAFSTLLDTQFALALIDLRRRGHVVTAIDVLRGAPFAEELPPTLDRMWELERAAMYRDMRQVGVDIVPWPPDARLDQVLRLLPRHRRMRRSRR